MLHQYSRQQPIAQIQRLAYSELKYWDKMHGYMLDAERKAQQR